MNIFVIASTLQAGGGITIYKQFLSHLPNHIGKNKYYIFINEILPQSPIDGVTYIVMPIQSKAKRMLFEGRMLESKVKTLGITPNIVISLQNNGYRCFKNCKHIVYFHQSIPLYPGNYNPFKSSERTLFNYKYIFPLIVKHTWAKDTHFIVQTPVVKKRFGSYFNIPSTHISVCFPDTEKINIEECILHKWKDDKKHLFFVGDDSKYRNSCTLVRAMAILKKENPDLASQIQIHITSQQENAPRMYAEILQNGVEENFIFEGIVKHDTLLSYYKSATAVLFPSSIETVGLPMLEAAVFGIPVLVADVDYAHEVMKNYQGVTYIGVYDYELWAEKIKEVCESSSNYPPLSQKDTSNWNILFNLIK